MFPPPQNALWAERLMCLLRNKKCTHTNLKGKASRNKKANGVFVQLYPVWRNLNISKEVTIRIFSTNVKSVLLHACETWKTTSEITRRLQIFVNGCLR